LLSRGGRPDRFGGLVEEAILMTDSGLDVDVAARLEATGPRAVRA
jgi:hypothetical protein